MLIVAQRSCIVMSSLSFSSFWFRFEFLLKITCASFASAEHKALLLLPILAREPLQPQCSIWGATEIKLGDETHLAASSS